jgi:hypothetical protein
MEGNRKGDLWELRKEKRNRGEWERITDRLNLRRGQREKKEDMVGLYHERKRRKIKYDS